MLPKPTRGSLLNKSHPLARGLVGYWLLSEGSGNKVFDLSGNNTGTNVNTPLWEPFKFGYGLHYDGSSQYTDLGASPSYTNDTKGTIVIWFSLDALFTEDGINQKLYGFGGGESGGNDGRFTFEVRRRDSVVEGVTRISLVQADDGYAWPGDVSGFMGSTDLVAGIVYCAVLVSDGSSWKIYLNGIEESLTSWGGDANNGDWFGDTSLTAPFSHLIAAATGGGAIANYFDGLIGDVMIYNRALSASEIALLYREPFCMFDRASWNLKFQISNFKFMAGTAAGTSDVSAVLGLRRGLTASTGGFTAVDGSLGIIGESPPEMERSWLREALFNGMTANAFKLGTSLSLGWFWVRVTGCSVLYRGESMGEIDFGGVANILTVSEQDAREISPPSYISHNSGSTYFYVVRRFNNCGYQEHTLTAAVKVSIKLNGELAEPQPNSISSVRVGQVDSNKIRLAWYYCPLEQGSRPVSFNIYYDDRTGQIDFLQTPLATIDYKGRRFYSFQSSALEADEDRGGYLFAIRAEDADGIENSSLNRLKIQLDTLNPDAIDILRAEAV